MKLLLFSNSTNAGEEYLTYPLPHIKNFLKNCKSDNIIFIPYAAVTFSFDEYVIKVNSKLKTIGLVVKGIHQFTDKTKAIKEADVIIVGGGNTFHLLKNCIKEGLLEPIREVVIKKNVPYIGWSAGSNLACPTICTTNDMPIVFPETFNALNLIPFQINPHYIDTNPPGHAGETREQRILEYITINKNTTVIGLREGCWIEVSDNKIVLKGNKTARIFKAGQSPYEITPESEIEKI
jgi:dipeptidase E